MASRRQTTALRGNGEAAWTPPRRYVFITLLVTGFIILLEVSGVLQGMNLFWYDLFCRLKGGRAPDSRILIVAVDEKTLEGHGRWPLPRSLYAPLLDHLREARVVAFDILFTDPAEDDVSLRQAMDRHGRVVLATYLNRRLQLEMPTEALAGVPVGHAHLEQDKDGVVRGLFRYLFVEGQAIPSLSIRARDMVTSAEPLPMVPGEDSAVLRQGSPLRINFYGPAGVFPAVSLADVLANHWPAEFFRDRLVLVGVTAPGMEEALITPMGSLGDFLAGVEVHATAMSNLLDGSFFRPLPELTQAVLLLVVAIPLLLLLFPMPGMWPVFTWALSAPALLAVSFFLLRSALLWAPPVPFFLLVSACAVIAHVARLETVRGLLFLANRDWEEAFDSISDAMLLQDDQGRTLRANKAAKGFNAPALDAFLRARCRRMGERGGKILEEDVVLPEDGRRLQIASFSRRGRGGISGGFVHVVRDLTETWAAKAREELLHAQLIQAQKMESVGRLAGGVAHDFNNILTAVLGYCQIIQMRLPADSPLREPLRVIQEAGERGAVLTRQLLSFSRRQETRVQPVDLNSILENLKKILTRLIGENVVLEVAAGARQATVQADPGQVEQVIMNLVVNARDAIHGEGRILVATGERHVTEEEASRYNRPPGRYAILSVRDTGGGIPEEIREKIFEPFFTTKEEGKGTGLGLSIVYGIVERHQGIIELESKPGEGTEFRVLFSALEQEAKAAVENPAPLMPEGQETILVVEDDRAVQAITRQALEGLGYTVMVAAGGGEALERLHAASAEIDLLLTDIVLPGACDGWDLMRRARTLRPGLPVVGMSGHVARGGRQEEMACDAFLEKPFTMTTLATTVRKVLDGGRKHAS